MKVSVALTTYNGSKYLEELLESIRTQTYQPDEVVICDDCSSDDTVEIVYNFIAEHALSNWRIYRNTKNIGWKQNFRSALNKCTNEIVFLCDQDDIWNPEKILECKQIMEKNDSVLLLASSYEPLNMDSFEDVKIRTLTKEKGQLEYKVFSFYSLSVLRPGCSYCVRQSLINFSLKNDNSDLPHDALLWGWGSILNGLFLYKKSLFKYRRHSGCASLSLEVLNRSKRISQIKYDLCVAKFYKDKCILNGLNTQEQIINEQIVFNTKRLKIIEERKVLALILFSLKNFKHYPTFRNMLSDIYLLFE